MSCDRTKSKIGEKMDNIGIIKKIDNLGRICIPKDLRERYELNCEIELIMTKDGILVRNADTSTLDTSKKKT